MRYQSILIWLAILALVMLLVLSQALAAPRIRDWHPGLPNPAKLTNIGFPELYVMGVPWCAATATMLATVTLHRELKLSEAYQIVGNCILPVIGGMIMRAMWNPAWDRLPLPPVWVKDFSIKSQS